MIEGILGFVVLGAAAGAVALFTGWPVRDSSQAPAHRQSEAS